MGNIKHFKKALRVHRTVTTLAVVAGMMGGMSAQMTASLFAGPSMVAQVMPGPTETSSSALSWLNPCSWSWLKGLCGTATTAVPAPTVTRRNPVASTAPATPATTTTTYVLQVDGTWKAETKAVTKTNVWNVGEQQGVPVPPTIANAEPQIVPTMGGATNQGGSVMYTAPTPSSINQPTDAGMAAFQANQPVAGSIAAAAVALPAGTETTTPLPAWNSAEAFCNAQNILPWVTSLCPPAAPAPIAGTTPPATTGTAPVVTGGSNASPMGGSYAPTVGTNDQPAVMPGDAVAVPATPPATTPGVVTPPVVTNPPITVQYPDASHTAPPPSSVPTQTTCRNGDDDDADGFIDYADPNDCHEQSNSRWESCSDGIDGDSDWLVDGVDPDCINGSETHGMNYTHPPVPLPTVPFSNNQPIPGSTIIYP